MIIESPCPKDGKLLILEWEKIIKLNKLSNTLVQLYVKIIIFFIIRGSVNMA